MASVELEPMGVKHFHTVKRLRKSVQYIRRYSMKYAFFGCVVTVFTNEL